MNIMAAYPTFTYTQIGNMTLSEWKLRMKAHRLSLIEAESLFYQIPFINRAVNATDNDGKYMYSDLKEIGIDLEAQRKELTGEAAEKINKYVELTRRANEARKLAKIQLARKGGN
ncbi:hypothetical protein ONZ78_01525 [Lactobacillus mulieris]|uniref:hypothetical protein n=1 Tax=Lactobacillus TaxID=1578 RepID=UPI001F337DC0|nr:MULTISPECIES: hypothetical protein [Lactobacillus]MCF1843903.1 hypothetical protein [Lactobacillus jensenii]MCW8105462.1 hypothetical protein [Lactobacillus mulieris]MDK7348118.1 hypothetical protein [Lactobacillus mulieris]